VIGHDHDRMESELVSVLLEATFQNSLPRCWRKLPAMVRGEGDKEWAVVLLDVRKATAVIILSLHKTCKDCGVPGL